MYVSLSENFSTTNFVVLQDHSGMKVRAIWNAHQRRDVLSVVVRAAVHAPCTLIIDHGHPSLLIAQTNVIAPVICFSKQP
jgi:hypothetical protein